ncbi:hypothetical protein [Lyngbya sp. PCC 8106]|uniref:hypothetical protein n=1 Tax=Lyngbya sp. (strain PCC 8106) TaxID=313612 RepID=UPI0000EAB549|nr:hypothetical protein [Lyngbya sp. PCC 8106]EAW36456.1 hypothetical protein L8106_11542 [Lyngbya sp. PCC 8106]
MNILPSILSFLNWYFQPAEKVLTTHSPTSSPVESPQKIEGKIIPDPSDLQDPIQIKPDNFYDPRFLPNFASDNFNDLSRYHAIKPHLK